MQELRFEEMLVISTLQRTKLCIAKSTLKTGMVSTILLSFLKRMVMAFFFSMCFIAHLNATPFGEPITPILLESNLDEGKVELGKRLFNDARLSKDGVFTCTSCHNFMLGGGDGRAKSIKFSGGERPFNTPTVFNVGLNYRFMWNGHVGSLEDQLDLVIKSKQVMNSSWEEIEAALTKDVTLVKQFEAVYDEGLKAKTIKNAIIIFQKSLITPNSRFDKYLRGDEAALTEEEMQGYRLFKSYGCVSCHQGVNVGGNMRQRLGVIAEPSAFFKDRGGVVESDLGLYNITKKEEDKYVFKVPSLRNVALTGPYLHDGSVATIEEVIDIMARYQLGREISEEEKMLIKFFLKTLTGEYLGRSLDNG